MTWLIPAPPSAHAVSVGGVPAKGHRNPASREAHGPLAQAFGRTCGLSADRRFHPPVDPRDEQTVALLPARQTGQDRPAVAQHVDVLTAERRIRFGFTVS